MFEESLKIDPYHYKALFNKAVVLVKMGEVEEGIKYYKASIEENPDYAYSYLNLGVIYIERGNYKKAIDIISEGIKNNLDAEFLYYNRACCYAKIHELSKALEDLREAVRLYPKFIEYIEKDDELKEVVKLEEYKELVKSALDTYSY
jgi:tetratricopeptide (TPR) repeat protein